MVRRRRSICFCAVAVFHPVPVCVSFTGTKGCRKMINGDSGTDEGGAFFAFFCYIGHI
ncbi:Uncharacterised protein [Klebsiella variicola]|nr:Uncharacterised protein [Klebsiella variicola]SXF44087.1 Uncharacterised protein [Klebsiella variicola]